MALSVVYFRITHRLSRLYYVWDEYGILIVYCRKLSLGCDCMCNRLCSVIVLCGMMLKGREKVKPGAAS